MDLCVDFGVEDVVMQLWKVKDVVSFVYDGYVVVYGNVFVIYYDDIVVGVQNWYDYWMMCIVNDLMLFEIKGLKMIVFVLYQVDEWMIVFVNECVMKQVFIDVQVKQQDLKIKVDGLQVQYDQWNCDYGIGLMLSVFFIVILQGMLKNILLMVLVLFVVN